MPAMLVPAYGAGTLDQQQAQAQAQQNLPWYQRVINALFGSGLSQQVQSLVNPLEAAAVLPREVLQTAKALGVPAKQIMDWSQAARPGVYIGFRAHDPGSVESTSNIGGTYATRIAELARSIASGADKVERGQRSISQVAQVVRKPLNVSIPEHRQFLERTIRWLISRTSNPAQKQQLKFVLKDVMHGVMPQSIPAPLKQYLSTLGYDAIISPYELEGNFPTIATLQPQRTFAIGTAPQAPANLAESVNNAMRRAGWTLPRQDIQRLAQEYDRRVKLGWIQGPPKGPEYVSQLVRLARKLGLQSHTLEAVAAKADLEHLPVKQLEQVQDAFIRMYGRAPRAEDAPLFYDTAAHLGFVESRTPQIEW